MVLIQNTTAATVAQRLVDHGLLFFDILATIMTNWVTRFESILIWEITGS